MALKICIVAHASTRLCKVNRPTTEAHASTRTHGLSRRMTGLASGRKPRAQGRCRLGRKVRPCTNEPDKRAGPETQPPPTPAAPRGPVLGVAEPLGWRAEKLTDHLKRIGGVSSPCGRHRKTTRRRLRPVPLPGHLPPRPSAPVGPPRKGSKLQRCLKRIEPTVEV